MKEARAAGTRSSAGAMAKNRGVGKEAGLGFPRPQVPPPAWDPGQEGGLLRANALSSRPRRAASATRRTVRDLVPLPSVQSPRHRGNVRIPSQR